MRKKMLAVLLCFCVVQLSIPTYTIIRHYDVLQTGELYKFMARPYDPYDPFRGRYVSFRTELSSELYSDDYVVLDKDINGFATVSAYAKTKPTGNNYVKNMDLSRYYMSEKLAPLAEKVQRDALRDDDSIYILVAVKKGYYVIKGLYINDMPIEDYILRQS